MDSPKSLSQGVKDQLPIFQLLPDKLQTPEAKKSMSKWAFWIFFAALTYTFVKYLPDLMAYARMLVLFVAYGILASILIFLYPKIVNLLHTWGEIMYLKSRKAMAEKYKIETLQIMFGKSKDMEKQVRNRITSVEGVRNNMSTSAEEQNKEAEKKFNDVRDLTKKAGDFDLDALDPETAKDPQRVRELKRKANELRMQASTAKLERENCLQLAKSYAQCANQLSKALEVLKDNESGMRIYNNLLGSSIRMAELKLQASSAMKKATDGLVDIFDVKQRAEFQWAMDAVQLQFSNDIASTSRNLEYLDENRVTNMVTLSSQSDLESFVTQMESGAIKKLDVREIADAGHILTRDEQVLPGFNILN